MQPDGLLPFPGLLTPFGLDRLPLSFRHPTDMSQTQLEQFQQELQKHDQSSSPSPAAILTALQKTLIARKDYHRLFDALLMESRLKLDLPLVRPASMDGIPEGKEQEFRDHYVKAARKVGALFLKDQQLADAWAYFRTINEPQPVRAAIEKLQIPSEPDEQFDEVVNLALYEGAHMVKGIEFLLATHGTCNTVTALSQLQAQMTAAERRQAAAIMVRTITDELLNSLKATIEAQKSVDEPSNDIAEIVQKHDWLFEGGSYHIDVSHLHSTVGFARALHQDDPELKLAVALCEYGRRLDGPLQYPGDVPFDDYYIANSHFLTALSGTNVEEGVQYFLKKLKDEPDEPDRRLISMVILDLAERTDQLPKVISHVLPHVGSVEDPNGFSFTEMCLDLNLQDQLIALAEQNDDPLAWAMARLTQKSE